MVPLRERHCKPCTPSDKALTNEESEKLVHELAKGWQVLESTKLQKEFPFENFKRGMAFAQEIAIIAEQEQHHPDICIHFKSVEVELTTHDVGGLSENDFILAAKIDEL